MPECFLRRKEKEGGVWNASNALTICHGVAGGGSGLPLPPQHAKWSFERGVLVKMSGSGQRASALQIYTTHFVQPNIHVTEPNTEQGESGSSRRNVLYMYGPWPCSTDGRMKEQLRFGRKQWPRVGTHTFTGCFKPSRICTPHTGWSHPIAHLYQASSRSIVPNSRGQKWV